MGKAYALSELRRYDEALKAFDEVGHINFPEEGAAYHWKGETLKRLGRLEEAQQAYEKAKELGKEE